LSTESAAAKVAAPIGEVTRSGEHPNCDKNWAFWIRSSNPNAFKLTDHDKYNVEELNMVFRYQNTASVQPEQLLEQQGVDSDESTQAGMESVLGALQCLCTPLSRFTADSDRLKFSPHSTNK
jgi:hypothetical protein